VAVAGRRQGCDHAGVAVDVVGGHRLADAATDLETGAGRLTAAK
jgi:hypothetical protein